MKCNISPEIQLPAHLTFLCPYIDGGNNRPGSHAAGDGLGHSEDVCAAAGL